MVSADIQGLLFQIVIVHPVLLSPLRGRGRTRISLYSLRGRGRTTYIPLLFERERSDDVYPSAP
jgi:hypothetical protein